METAIADLFLKMQTAWLPLYLILSDSLNSNERRAGKVGEMAEIPTCILVIVTKEWFSTMTRQLVFSEGEVNKHW